MCLSDEKYVYLLLMLCETIDIFGFGLGENFEKCYFFKYVILRLVRFF